MINNILMCCHLNGKKALSAAFKDSKNISIKSTPLHSGQNRNDAAKEKQQTSVDDFLCNDHSSDIFDETEDIGMPIVNRKNGDNNFDDGDEEIDFVPETQCDPSDSDETIIDFQNNIATKDRNKTPSDLANTQNESNETDDYIQLNEIVNSNYNSMIMESQNVMANVDRSILDLNFSDDLSSTRIEDFKEERKEKISSQNKKIVRLKSPSLLNKSSDRSTSNTPDLQGFSPEKEKFTRSRSTTPDILDEELASTSVANASNDDYPPIQESQDIFGMMTQAMATQGMPTQAFLPPISENSQAADDDETEDIFGAATQKVPLNVEINNIYHNFVKPTKKSPAHSSKTQGASDDLFDQPTQKISTVTSGSKSSKRGSLLENSNDDIFEQNTQVLAAPNQKVDKNDSFFDRPTQILPVPKSKKSPKTIQDEIKDDIYDQDTQLDDFNQPTQVMPVEMNSNKTKKETAVRAKDTDDIFEQATQAMAPPKPVKQKRNNRIVDVFDQPTQEIPVEAKGEIKSTTAKKTSSITEMKLKLKNIVESAMQIQTISSSPGYSG